MKNGFLKRIVYVICLFSALLLFRQAGIYFVEQSLEEWEASLQYSIEDIYAPWNPVITEMFGNSWEDMRITDVLVSKSHSRHDSMIALIAVPEAEQDSIHTLLENLSCISYEGTGQFPSIQIQGMVYPYDLCSPDIGMMTGSVRIYRLLQREGEPVRYLLTKRGILSSDIDRIIASIQKITDTAGKSNDI